MKYCLSLFVLLCSFSFGAQAQSFEGDVHYSIEKDNSESVGECSIYCKGHKMRIEILEGDTLTETILVDFEKMEIERIISWFGKKTVLVSKLKTDFKVAELGPLVYMSACNISGKSEKVTSGGVAATLVMADCSVNGAVISGEWWPCVDPAIKTSEALIGIPWLYEIQSGNSSVKLVMNNVNQRNTDDSVFIFDDTYPKLSNTDLGKGFELIEKE